MPQKVNPIAVFSIRLKEAREHRGLSQKQLGIAAGLDRFVASTRINRYERGVHRPDPVTAQRLAESLGIPTAYLFTHEDRIARLLLAFHALPVKAQDKVVAELEQMARPKAR